MNLLKKYGLKEFRDAKSPDDIGNIVHAEDFNRNSDRLLTLIEIVATESMWVRYGLIVLSSAVVVKWAMEFIAWLSS